MSKVLVYGLGVSGKGAVALLSRLKIDFAVYCDSFCEANDDIDNRSSYNSLDAVLENISTIVVSPSVLPSSPLLMNARKKNIPIIPEIEYAAMNCKADIIAITGTNGKTTTTELISQLLTSASIHNKMVGNIGYCFAEQAIDMPSASVAVLEASSFQLEMCRTFAPKYAICLNITPDHLERHGCMADYIEAKSNIFINQKDSDYAILNYDDTNLCGISNKIPSNTYYFSRKSIVKGAYLCGSNIYFKQDIPQLVCSISDIKMIGEHNLENALAMITLAKILNYPNSVIIRTLNNFLPPRHRVEYIGNYNDTRYYNDSKSTNPASTLVACKSMVGKTVLLIGGYDKGISYRALFDNIPLKISAIICYGANRNMIIQEAMTLTAISILEAKSLKHAIELSSCIKAKNVLLSPGTSSYDSFKNYEIRGEYFVKTVKELLSEE